MGHCPNFGVNETMKDFHVHLYVVGGSCTTKKKVYKLKCNTVIPWSVNFLWCQSLHELKNVHCSSSYCVCHRSEFCFYITINRDKGPSAGILRGYRH
jgi:hypothetical protein